MQKLCWGGGRGDAAFSMLLPDTHHLRVGVLIDTGPRQGWTPLHYAARNGQSEVVGALLDKGGAAVNATDVSGRRGAGCMLSAP
jgi:hypothetical protein